MALHLPQEIVDYCEKLIPQKWPPTIEGLTAEDNEPPPNAAFFLRHLLCDGKHSTSASDNLSQLIDSFGADLIHGVSRGKVITTKHFLLALGLHNLTGKKEAIVIINKLGHCISYDKTCDIEIAQAEVVLKQSAIQLQYQKLCLL